MDTYRNPTDTLIDNFSQICAGQTMVVSGAAGAVGSVAAQLGKARGMKAGLEGVLIGLY